MRVNLPWGNISGFLFATFPKIEMSLTSVEDLRKTLWTKQVPT